MQSVNVLQLQSVGETELAWGDLQSNTAAVEATWSAYTKLWEAGILHRDVSLRHLRLRRVGNELRAVLIDFGQARLLMHNLVAEHEHLSDEDCFAFQEEKCAVRRMLGLPEARD